MVPFSAVVMWTFGEKIGNGWKKILWQSGKIAFIFSVSIEMLQLLLRLGTFQLSDIFYNTVGGLDWDHEKWRGSIASKFIRGGEKNAVKYADEMSITQYIFSS